MCFVVKIPYKISCNVLKRYKNIYNEYKIEGLFKFHIILKNSNQEDINVLYNEIYTFTPTGKIENDINSFLLKYNKEITYKHSIRVANEARKIAEMFHENEEKVAIAAYLHDISAIFPNEERIAVAEEFGIEILQEERKFPMIIHQKLSRLIAKEVFKVEDEEVLNAISCHTTLRKNATKMDLILFIADKIEWDQKGTPPYILKVKMDWKNHWNMLLPHISHIYGKEKIHCF